VTGNLIDFAGGGERYLSREELAERLGVGLTTLDKMRKQGMPSHTWQLRTRKFLWSEVRRWLAEQDRMVA
jgi:phage terminase Nu1 subunit (DNA packaging protein)